MKTVTNIKLIKRNAKIGQYLSFAALAVLGIGLYISFKMPDKFAYSLAALLIGFLMSQVGINFTNRWGRNPRPDDIIDKSLKGLGREFTIYHYVTPVSHLLVGPSGLWAIMPYFLSGTVAYDKNRWRVKGGGFLQSYMRLFGQENIGRPDLESQAEIDSAKRYLTRVLPEGTEIPPIRTILLFANPKVELKVENAPIPAMLPKDLKDFLRQESKEKAISDGMLSTIRAALPQAEKEE
ncbi:MAG: hypothetical protein ABSF99_10120 [Anaerolineales bacterium]